MEKTNKIKDAYERLVSSDINDIDKNLNKLINEKHNESKNNFFNRKKSN